MTRLEYVAEDRRQTWSHRDSSEDAVVAAAKLWSAEHPGQEVRIFRQFWPDGGMDQIARVFTPWPDEEEDS